MVYCLEMLNIYRKTKMAMIFKKILDLRVYFFSFLDLRLSEYDTLGRKCMVCVQGDQLTQPIKNFCFPQPRRYSTSFRNIITGRSTLCEMYIYTMTCCQRLDTHYLFLIKVMTFSVNWWV